MFIRDIIWPSIVKLGEANTLVFSMRLNHAVEESDREDYEYLADMIRKRSYEIDESLEEKEIEIPFICSGHKRDNEETFKMQSSISGSGLATYYLDMSEVMGKNADDPEYEWASYSLELSKMMYDLYQNTEWIDTMTVSQAMERYKRYLLIRPQIQKSADQIIIKTENFQDVCYYMIRTEKKVSSGNGYEVTKAGDNAYLIEVLEDDIVIQLEENAEKAQ